MNQINMQPIAYLLRREIDAEALAASLEELSHHYTQYLLNDDEFCGSHQNYAARYLMHLRMLRESLLQACGKLPIPA